MRAVSAAASVGGAKSWVFCYRSPVHRTDRKGKLVGKPREMGLGPVEIVSLSVARDRAHDLRKLLDQGLDPLDIPADAAKPKPIPSDRVDRIHPPVKSYQMGRSRKLVPPNFAKAIASKSHSAN